MQPSGLRKIVIAVELYADAAEFMSRGSKVEIVAGTGHFFHVAKPAAVNRLIVDWAAAQP